MASGMTRLSMCGKELGGILITLPPGYNINCWGSARRNWDNGGKHSDEVRTKGINFGPMMSNGAMTNRFR